MLLNAFVLRVMRFVFRVVGIHVGQPEPVSFPPRKIKIEIVFFSVKSLFPSSGIRTWHRVIENRISNFLR